MGEDTKTINQSLLSRITRPGRQYQATSRSTTAIERNCGMVLASQKLQPAVTESEKDLANKNEGDDGSIVRFNVKREINKQVLRQKLAKRRHLVCREAIHPSYMDSLFPATLELFDPQTVHYNGGVAAIKEWKISCYLEVMDGGIPTTNPNTALFQAYQPLLNECNDLFMHWYRQQHACSGSRGSSSQPVTSCRRLMTFLTRYTPNPGEEALLKHVDGAGKVDGSIVVALPIDRWTAPEAVNTFEGGGLTFWDGRKTTADENGRKATAPCEIHYDTRAGDVAFIDRAVWHQADPITTGTRWALVIFYKVE